MKKLFLGNLELIKFIGILILFHLLVLICFMTYFNFNFEVLKQWDSQHYFLIKEYGYPKASAAFFPLFPIIWGVFKFSTLQISILNLVFYSIGIFVLFKDNHLNIKDKLWAISLTMFFYFSVPYTESLSFLGVAFLIYCQNKKTILGYLFLSL